MSSVVLATRDREFEGWIRSSLGSSSNGELRLWSGEIDGDPAGAAGAIVGRDTKVLVLGPDVGVEQALQVAHAVDERFPQIIVLIVVEPTPELWRKALHAGVRDVLDPKATTREVRLAVERALEAADRRKREHSQENGGSSSRLITVASPKGGAGKTVVASNLAIGLALHRPGRVVLVDLDLQFGDIAHALLLMPEHTMTDAARARALDITTLKVFLTPHQTNLYTLCAPDSPAEGEEVAPERVGEILDLLTDHFDYVIVDTSSGINEHTLAALDRSTDLVMVSEMDVASVRAIQKLVEALDDLGMSFAHRHFVLNRANSRVGIEEHDIVATLGMDVDLRIPSSRLFPLSLNQGRPLLFENPRSPAARPLHDLVRRVGELSVDRTGGFRRWRRQ